MTSKYTVRIRINTLRDYMNYQKFIWTHSFHASLNAGGRYLDAHQTERMLFLLPLGEADMHFSWVPDEKMEEFRRFFRSHGLLAEETQQKAGSFRRPAFQA